VGNAGIAGQGFGRKPRFEVDELAFGAAAVEPAVMDRGDAGGIITAIFEPFQSIDKSARHRLNTHDPDNSAHPAVPLSKLRQTLVTGKSRHGNGSTIKFDIQR
jgi:hypothetical protein